MSTSYSLEPTPTAKVLLKTTSGDILLELFAKETPLASRNFLQLCLDGYYDGTIFHRLVPGFIIQGGDPTGTGHGGEAIYDGGLFADEFNSRLRFNRRGMLGMANGGVKDDNGSQFFITLAECRELDKKNTVFGRVAGDTIYNVMKMGKAELDGITGSDRPMYPTRITGAEIIVNPFEDMKKREQKVSTAGKDDGKVVKKKKKKTGKQMLSFADDEEEGGEGGGGFRAAGMKKKPLYDTRLVTDAPMEDVDDHEARGRERSKTPPKKMREMIPQVQAPPGPAPVPEAAPRSTKSNKKNTRSSRSPSTPSRSPSPEETRLSHTEKKIAEVKASMKRSAAADDTESSSASKSKSKSKSLLDIQRSMLPSTSVPARKRKRNGAEDTAYENSILSAMDAFKSKLISASKSHSEQDTKMTDASDVDAAATTDNNAEPDILKAESGGIDPDADEQNFCDLHFIPNCKSCNWHEAHDGEEDDDDADAWLSHKLTFEKDRLGKDLTWKKKNEEELVVIDPREKTREVLREERRKKDERRGGNKAFRHERHDRHSHHHDRDRDRERDRDRDRDRDQRR